MCVLVKAIVTDGVDAVSGDPEGPLEVTESEVGVTVQKVIGVSLILLKLDLDLLFSECYIHLEVKKQ